MSPKERRSDGERTHAAILDAAMRLASVEGLEALTIGRLAQFVGVSKSGVYAHFGSREQLQLETIDAARAVFEREVLAHASVQLPALARLKALCEAYFSYVERMVFPGGCFFASLLAEMDGRAGALHELVADGEREWLGLLTAIANEAQRAGELSRDVHTEQLAFELEASLALANYHFVLFRDVKVIERARWAVGRILERSTTPTAEQ